VLLNGNSVLGGINLALPNVAVVVGIEPEVARLLGGDVAAIRVLAEIAKVRWDVVVEDWA